MSKIALIAEFEVKPDHRDAFQKLMRTHGQAALDHEPGCLQFDVAVPRDNPNQVFLYEIYRDEKALDDHMSSPGLAATRGSYAHMIAAKRVTISRVL